MGILGGLIIPMTSFNHPIVFTFTFYTPGVRGGASHIGTRALASEEIMIVWMIEIIVVMIMDNHDYSDSDHE